MGWALPEPYLDKSLSVQGEAVWAEEGNASGRYKQTREGPAENGLLILQRALALVTVTLSPLQKP